VGVSGILVAVVWSALGVSLVALGLGLRYRRAKTLLSVGSLVLTLLLAEAILRMTYPPSLRPVRKIPSREYHHVNRPDATMYHGRYEGVDAIVRTNEDGFRSKPSRKKFLRSSHRIVVLGDSFTFGSGVRQDAAFPQVMESDLRERLNSDDVAVLNAGVISYSPLLGWRIYDGVVAGYRPTLVLYVLDVTDMGDDYNYTQELVDDGAAGHFDWSDVWVSRYYGAIGELVDFDEMVDDLGRPLRVLQRRLGFKPRPVKRYRWYRFHAAVGGLPENDRFFVYRHPLEDTMPFFERTYEYVEALAESVRRSGAEFILVVAPRFHHWNAKECPDNWEAGKHALDEPYQYEYFRFFDEQRATAPFEIFSLLPAFQATREFPLVFRDDPHWNEAGHAFVARTLAEHLVPYLAD
jgi:hypothetical protein